MLLNCNSFVFGSVVLFQNYMLGSVSHGLILCMVYTSGPGRQSYLRSSTEVVDIGRVLDKWPLVILQSLLY